MGMRPADYSSNRLRAALAISIALHIALVAYLSRATDAAVEAPLQQPVHVVFTLDRVLPPAEEPVEPVAAVPEPAPVAEPEREPLPEPEPEPVAEPDPLPEPEPEPVPEPEPKPVPEPQPEPKPEPQVKPAPQAQVEPTPAPAAEPMQAAEVQQERDIAPEPMRLAGASLEPTVHEVERLPRELSAPPPRYPASELRRGIEDTVQVRLLINEKGRVEDVEFLAGGPSFQRALESVVYRWKFEPAVVDGRPVKVWGTKTVQFALHRN